MKEIKWKIANIGNVPVYTVWEDGGGIDIIYAPFHQRVMSLTPFLRELSEHSIEEQLSIVPELQDSQYTLEQINAEQVPEDSTVHLSIGLSNNCTLRCSYCHANATVGDAVIDTATLRSVIDSAFVEATKRNNKEILVSFSAGGEPTFNWNNFIEAVVRIRKQERNKGIKTKIQMTTNGYYGNRKRNFIVKNLDQVTLSLDGIEDIQNKQRPAINGKATFRQVVETGQFFYKRKFPFGIRATVTKQSSNHLCEFVQYVADAIGRVPMAFEPVVPVGRAVHHDTADQNEVFAVDLEAFAKSFWSAYLIGEKVGIPVSTSSINLQKIVPKMCGAMALPALTVTSKGKITACHRDNDAMFSYGEVNSNGSIILDSERINEIRALSEAPPTCDKCFCRYSCGGDCPDLRINNLNRCVQTRYLTFRALEHKAKVVDVPD